MNPILPRLRLATLGDAEAVARIHVETWRSAYRGILPDAYLAGLSIERRTAFWEKNLREQPDRLLVAEYSDAVLGWAAFGPCREPGEETETEICAIYVDAAEQRRGVGALLLAAAEVKLREAQPGATRISLWVLERNLPARAFYERHGYLAGARVKPETIGGETFVEVRYEKSLRSRA